MNYEENELIRVSMSYLYKIQINDKYLLIKSRKKDSYQPIGGCYMFKENAREFFNNYSITLIDPTIKEYLNDFRLYVPKKFLPQFIEWYNKEIDRELNLDREFFEELCLENNFIKKEDFSDVTFRKIKDGNYKIGRYGNFTTDCIFYMDIVKPNLQTKHIELLKDIAHKSNNILILASREEIEQGFIFINNEKKFIGDHTPRIFNI